MSTQIEWKESLSAIWKFMETYRKDFIISVSFLIYLSLVLRLMGKNDKVLKYLIKTKII